MTVSSTILLTSSTPTQLAATSPTDVLIDISTSVLIQDYSKYYDSPIQSFHPTYYALSDGSLVCPPLIRDLNQLHVSLALSAALCAFFVMNILSVIRYIRWGKVKNKSLFYVLLASQVAGLIALVSYFVGIFNQSASCYVVVLMTHIFYILSISLLITGIFGVKAYRCLNNSRTVVVWLCILRGLSLILSALDLSSLTASRRLSGSCTTSSGPTFMIAIFVSELAQMLFISSCFFYALWKLHRLPAPKGRFSVSATVDPGPRSSRRTDTDARRGWWDYVPKDPLTSKPSTDGEPVPLNSSYLSKIRYAWAKLWDSDTSDVLPQWKPPLSTDYPISRPGEPTFPQYTLQRIVKPPWWQGISGFPRLKLFKFLPLKVFAKVLRNELVFTAVIAFVQLIGFVVSVVGMYKGTLIQTYLWSAVNWVLASSLTLHSFRRVVRRHDREFYQQQQTVWRPIYRAESELQAGSPEYFRSWTCTSSRISRRSVSSTHLSSSRDPFNDLNLPPIQARCYQQSNPPLRPQSVHTMDSGLAIPWARSSVQVDHPFLDIPPSMDSQSSSSSAEITPSETHSVYNGYDVFSHRPFKGEGWDPPDPP